TRLSDLRTFQPCLNLSSGSPASQIFASVPLISSGFGWGTFPSRVTAPFKVPQPVVFNSVRSLPSVAVLPPSSSLSSSSLLSLVSVAFFSSFLQPGTTTNRARAGTKRSNPQKRNCRIVEPPEKKRRAEASLPPCSERRAGPNTPCSPGFCLREH